MAKGEVVSAGPTSVADDAFLDTQPAAGTEVTIHNLYLPPAASGYELHWYDGSTSQMIDTLSGPLYNCMFHVTNTRRIRVKNVVGSSQNLGYDGIQSK